MNKYYIEIEHLIKKNEVNKRVRRLQENSEELETKWNIGKLLVEAQGGKEHAKYGDNLIKEWAKSFTLKYGNGYSTTNLRYYRQFYLSFPMYHALSDILCWTHFRILLTIKEENERNYYINLCIENNLSTRELENLIKEKTYDRIVDKPSIIDIKSLEEKNIKYNLKNPIIIRLNKDEVIKNEKELQLKILSQLQSFFLQLGNGFALIGNEYKIVHNGKLYFIDILLFNYKYNKFIVVELKFRELRQTDKGEIELYMKLVDEHVKEAFHNKTIGIIISKEQDEFIATYVGREDIFPITYQLYK